MKLAITGRKIFLILAFISPLFYLSMYLPLWIGNALRLSSAFVTVLFAFQCVSIALSATRLYLDIFRKPPCRRFVIIGDIIAVLSIAVTLFYGLIFTLEVCGIPWFPAQS